MACSTPGGMGEKVPAVWGGRQSCSRGRKVAAWPRGARSTLRQIKLEGSFRCQRPSNGTAAGLGVESSHQRRRQCVAVASHDSRKEDRMYAAIRQGKAKTGMAEELTRRIKEGAIPIISDVEGFMGYYVVYAPDDTVTAISLFNNFASAEEANRRAIAWIEKDLAPLLTGPATAMAGPVIVHTLA